MVNSGWIRTIDENGRVPIPKPVRAALNVSSQDKFEFWYDSNSQELLLRPYMMENVEVRKAYNLRQMIVERLAGKRKEREAALAHLDEVIRILSGGDSIR